MNFKYNEYQKRPIIAKPFNRLSETISKLDAQHQEAIKQRTAIDVQLANLDLNEAEDKWRADKAEEIRNKIDSQVQFGNYATALTEATKAAGDILSDRGLIGRQKAQAEYKKFNAELDQRKDIDETTKEYYRELNPYSYSDTKDEKGRIIGGTTWEPKARPVGQVDMSRLMQQAIQMTAKETGGGNTIYYMDKNGNMTPDITQSYDGLPYINKSGRYEALPKDKLKAGLDAVIRNTPGAMESIKQDYDVAVWKTKKDNGAGKLTISSVTDDKGQFLTEDQYLAKRVDPFFKSATYYRAFNETSPLAGLSTGALRARKALGNQKESQGLDDLSYTKAGMREEQLASASELIAKKDVNRTALSNIAASKNIAITPDMDGKAIYDKLMADAKLKGYVLPKDAIDNYKEWQDSESKYKQLIPPNSSKEVKDAVDFTTAIDGGVDLAPLIAKGNPLAEEYMKNINSFFGDKAKAIMIKVPDNKAGELIKDIDGTEKGKHRRMGISIETKNGATYVKLDREHATNLMYIGKAANKYSKDNFWRTISGTEDTPNFFAVDENGKVLGDKTGNAKGGKTLMGLSGMFGDDLYNKANNIYKSIINTEPKVAQVEVQAVGMNDFLTTYARDAVSSGKYSDETAAMKAANEMIWNNFDTYQAEMGPMSFGKSGESMKDIKDGSERNKLFSLVKAIKVNDPKRIQIAYDKQNLSTIVTVLPDPTNKNADGTYSGTDIKLGEELKFYLPDMTNSQVKQMVLSNPAVQAANKLWADGIAGIKETKVAGDAVIENLGNRSYIYHSPNGSIPINEKQAATILTQDKMFDNYKYQVYSAGGYDNLSNDSKAALRKQILVGAFARFGIPFPESVEDIAKYPNVINEANSILENIKAGYDE